jgi:hypothetical protein
MIRYAVVAGVVGFPIDMLRYDECSPATEHDSAKICQSLAGTGRLEIGIRYMGHGAGHGLTAGRWKSFGWEILEMNMRSPKHWPLPRRGD